MQSIETEIANASLCVRETDTQIIIGDEKDFFILEKTELSPGCIEVFKWLQDNYNHVLLCSNPDCNESGNLYMPRYQTPWQQQNGTQN